MKNVLLIILTMFAINTAVAGNNDPGATQKLVGQVVDENGNSLAGVEVKIEGLEKKVYTDFDGNFEIDHLKSGAYTVVVNIVAYKEAKKVLTTKLNNSEKALIKLQQKEMKLR